MTSFSLTFSVFKSCLMALQSMFNHLIESNAVTKRVHSVVSNAEDNLKFVRDQERNEAEDLRHF